MKKHKYWYAYTPGDTLCVETKAKTREECIKKLLEATSHMPYRNWDDLKSRGYTVVLLDLDV